MYQYIGSGQNDQFDVRVQELVSKVKKMGGILRKKRFRVHFGVFSCGVAIFGSRAKNDFSSQLIL